MPDVTTFNIGGTAISVKDATARSSAAAAQSAAVTATTTADSAKSVAQNALKIAKGIEELGRVEVTYASESETITITTSNHDIS